MSSDEKEVFNKEVLDGMVVTASRNPGPAVTLRIKIKGYRSLQVRLRLEPEKARSLAVAIMDAVAAAESSIEP